MLKHFASSLTLLASNAAAGKLSYTGNTSQTILASASSDTEAVLTVIEEINDTNPDVVLDASLCYLCEPGERHDLINLVKDSEH